MFIYISLTLSLRTTNSLYLFSSAAVQAPTVEECFLPDNIGDFSLITEEGAKVSAQLIYSGVAIGGAYEYLEHQSSAVVSSHTNGMRYVNNLVNTHNVNFKGGVETGVDINMVINFDKFRHLALNAESSDINGKKVIVMTSGGTFDLYDFVPNGQADDNGNTLVIFNTEDDVTLTETNDGRFFGPSVIAPFSKVYLHSDAGFIDGFVVAKEFETTGPNAHSLQVRYHACACNVLQC